MEEHLFSVLDLDVSLAHSAEAIESAWRKLSAATHPDVTGEEDAAARINQAREILVTPVGLLEQWLAANGVVAEKRTSISPQLMDLFSLVGESLQQADDLISKHQTATTALAKSLLAAPAISAQKSIQQALAEVTQATNSRVATFPDIEKGNDTQSAQEVLNELKFLAKWSQQCQQRLVALIAI